MGALSDDDAANFLNAKFGGASLSVPSHYYVALSTTEPADDGSNVTEPSGAAAAGYARLSVAVSTTNFPATSTRSIANGVPFTFSAPAVGDDWGVTLWYALYDATTAGAFRGWGQLADSVHVVGGEAGPTFPAGAFVINAPGS